MELAVEISMVDSERDDGFVDDPTVVFGYLETWNWDDGGEVKVFCRGNTTKGELEDGTKDGSGREVFHKQ
jgi:hypothetical protein